MYPYVIEIEAYTGHDVDKETRYHLVYGDNIREAILTLIPKYYHEDEVIYVKTTCVGDEYDTFQVSENIAKRIIENGSDIANLV